MHRCRYIPRMPKKILRADDGVMEWQLAHLRLLTIDLSGKTNNLT